MTEAKDTRPMIYFNEDNHHFYGAHPPQDMTVEGLNRTVVRPEVGLPNMLTCRRYTDRWR